MSLKIVPSRETLSFPLRILAILKRTPEIVNMLNGLWVSISGMTVEIFLVRETLARTVWDVTLEGQCMALAVLAAQVSKSYGMLWEQSRT